MNLKLKIWKVTITLLTFVICFGQANAQVSAQFSADPLTICFGETITFEHLDGTNVREWQWDFGNDNYVQITDDIGPHSVQFNSPGTKTVTLIVNNADTVNYEADTVTLDVVVNPPVEAAFSYTGLTNLIPTALDFTVDDPQPGYTYEWSLGDPFGAFANTANGDRAVRQYEHEGSYTVCLTATQDLGCSKTTCRVIEIDAAANDDRLDFSISPPSQTCVFSQVAMANMSVEFIDDSLRWDFGTDAVPASFIGTDPPPVYWTSPGPKAITVKAGQGDNPADFKAKSIIYEVLDYPVAGFSVVPDTCDALSATFIPDVNLSEQIYYSWDFGDGTTSKNSRPSKAYGSAGTFEVTLTATNKVCTSTYTQSIRLGLCNEPTAGGMVVAQGYNSCQGKLFIFENNIAGSTASWNFGANGTPSTASGNGPIQVIFTENTPITVSMTAAGQTITKNLQ
ncbi:MAG: PKD domain-containing protein [Bacteroidota bacterium]